MSTNAVTTNRLMPPRCEPVADNIPERLRRMRRFVRWKWDWRTKKWDKPPIDYATGGNIDKTNPSNWNRFDDVLNGHGHGVGFCIAKKKPEFPEITEDDPIVVIDLDNCVDPDTQTVNDWARYCLESFASYSEFSPSGCGIKIYVRGKLKDGNRENADNTVELLGPGAYVCITGRPVPGTPKDVADAQAIIEFFQEIECSKVQQKNDSDIPDDELARLALQALDPNMGYRDWVNTGMAMHKVNSSAVGLDAWDSWSKGSEKYVEGECAKKWKTFNSAGKLGLGSLIYWAKQRGWQPPPRKTNGNRNPHTDAFAKQTDFRSSDYICNAVVTRDDKEKHVKPVPMTEILRRIQATTDNWPRRIGPTLFVHESDEISFLEKSAALWGFVGTRSAGPPTFINAANCHTKNEVFEELRRTATGYEAVERFPHEPIMPGHYYACDIPEPGDGSYLREIVSRFNPETEIDRDLIQAAFVTAGWGGRGGSRPAFVVTSDDGRGVGKTSVVNSVGYLYGGTLELVANEDAARIKTRLLSPEGLLKRVVLLDNAKTRCLSWADLEGMITAPAISGHRLFTGEMTRPNVITWCVTMNGGSYSTDLAQRSVFIKLAKPIHSGNWEESLREFIDANRQRIFADVIGFLRKPRAELSRYSRWGAWDQDVLSRLPEPEEAQRLIQERRATADAEVEEAEIIDGCFREKIAGLQYLAHSQRVFIPSHVACDWLSAALKERFTTIAASRTLGQFIDEGKLPHIERCASRAIGRGFMWVGEDWTPDDETRTDLECRLERQDRGYENQF